MAVGHTDCRLQFEVKVGGDLIFLLKEGVKNGYHLDLESM
jgi:predicted ferric reductase